ncbi:MAG: CBS domain-containing protein [Planctomycetota bacterium]
MNSDTRISKVQELVYEIRVRDVMKDNVFTVSPQTPMSKLQDILREKRISGAPVVDNDKLAGIISIDDFIRWLAEREDDCPISEKMTSDVKTLYADEPLIHAVNKFEKHGFGRFVVIDRQDKRLRGIITKGDIIEGLLKKLEIDYHKDEVAGKDFKRAGESSSRLKATLGRLGLHPQVIRRVAIATYEAEMNLIIYADGGKIRVRVEPHEILVKVEDTGPGIPDVEKALQPGYSTAPDWVRELGFGAGMGLNNISNCADRMNLKSTAGKGTRLSIHIFIEDGVKSETN